MEKRSSMDRLSALPDDIICHILSFLPTKISAATSILSRRWGFLWICVKKLDLWLEHATLPRCLFTCKTLVDLTLYDGCVGMPSSGPVFLPSLKKLHVCRVKYQDVEAFPQLLSGCPVLEELIIRYNYLDCFNISSPTIKRLTVQCERNNFDSSVKINAPELRHLQLRDIAFAGSIVKFDNLTKLELGVEFCFLMKLLEIADNLEVLILIVKPHNWMEPKQVPTCLLLHLRTIKIDQFWFEGHEFNMVRYLLKNAQVLERMGIHLMYSDLKAKSYAVKRISSFKRRSEACELAFH
ncbi:hypothetical protein DH2020_031730 [Rehmannia glutinosa]|uniref:FBD domain-containing protein n=1 Tax=Rehmannia glutinosa TaxID=99300 RepID=A0ABR0VH83_REHGL